MKSAKECLSFPPLTFELLKALRQNFANKEIKERALVIVNASQDIWSR